MALRPPLSEIPVQLQARDIDTLDPNEPPIEYTLPLEPYTQPSPHDYTARVTLLHRWILCSALTLRGKLIHVRTALCCHRGNHTAPLGVIPDWGSVRTTAYWKVSEKGLWKGMTSRYLSLPLLISILSLFLALSLLLLARFILHL